MSSSCDSPYSFEDCKVTMRLLEFSKKTNYQIVQENGQRRITAPEIFLGKLDPSKGAEVFIGRLPRDCYEDELFPMLSQVGRVLELRMMLDFSMSTRGYAFALYEDSKTARKVCEQLDGQEIRFGHRIGVVKSLDNCRLFFGGVPKDKTKEEFMEELTKLLEGIIDIYVYPSSQDRRLNRGFIFVEFKNHRAAAMARRKLVPGKVVLWNHEIAVDWADPEPGDPVDDDQMEMVTALFVRNLDLETTPQQMKEVMQKATKTQILKMKKINHFAFVHYESRESAQTVLNIMNKPGGLVDKYKWEVRWAKPIGVIKSLERQRCINEAIAKPQENKARGKQQKKIVKSTTHDKENQVSNRKLMPFDALKDLVAKMWQANCVYEIREMSESFGYICNLFIFTENCLISEFSGDRMNSKHEALTNLNTLASVVYQMLHNQFNCNSVPLMRNP